ncbi:MAG: hypothetical protein K0A90_00275 [Methanosarcinaceae archaeon]|nr:hypothetical protein [Methanosarcinaceae archaeon]
MEILKNCEESNGDGAGISWREGNKIKWSKGHNAEEIYTLSQSVELPFIVHFRFATVGGSIKELCHPFSVTKDVKTTLKGSAKEVIMHNGHWSNWSEALKNNMICSSARIPTGVWSDTRAIAYFTNRCGSGFLQMLDEKVVLFNMKHITIFGSGWTEEDNGIIYSNTEYKGRYKSVYREEKWTNRHYRNGYYKKNGHSYGQDYEDNTLEDEEKEFETDRLDKDEKCKNATICMAEYMD